MQFYNKICFLKFMILQEKKFKHKSVDFYGFYDRPPFFEQRKYVFQVFVICDSTRTKIVNFVLKIEFASKSHKLCEVLDFMTKHLFFPPLFYDLQAGYLTS